jgi:hypothetical protein
MKMRKLYFVSAMSLLAIATLWSCQDDFTDEDLINKQETLGQDSIDLSILVYNASIAFTSTNSGDGQEDDNNDNGYDEDYSNSGRSSKTNGLANLTVTISKNGKVVSATTDANGIALFSGLQPGTIVGTVTGAGFTSTNFTISVKEGENSNGTNEPTTNAGAVIPVFETEGEHVATVTGRATCELNLLNAVRENVPNGTKVSFSIDTDSESFDELLESLLGLGLLEGSVTSASVDELSFEGSFVTSITNGTFTIDLPTTQSGLDYTYSFSDFTADQQIAVNNFVYETPGSLRSVQTISTQFGKDLDYDYSSQVNIPSLAGVQLDVQAPPAAGSGAAATAALMPAAAMINLVSGSGYEILASGSGYGANQTGIPVTVSGGAFDNTVTGATAAVITANADAQGRIVSLSGTLGFGYKGTVTLSVGGSGTGAIISPRFQSTITPLFGLPATLGGTRTTITAGGSGYVVPPTVIFVGFDVLGQQVVTSSNAVVNNGVIVSFDIPGTSFSAPPTITFQPQQRINATALVNGINTTTGSITGASFNNGGSGYNSLVPPTITVRDLRNTGAGAVIVAETSTSGSIVDIEIISGGTGYSTLGFSFSYYANYPTDFEGFYTNYNSVLTLKPGETRNLNAHYGTGVHPRGLE